MSISQLKSMRSGNLDRLAAHWDCTTEAAMWLSCQTTVDLAIDCWHIPYSGKFSYGANFRIFRMLHPLYENKNCENLNVRNRFFRA